MNRFEGLRGVRVVDCTTGIAGAYATKLFADAGADVVKLEAPDGDPLRRWSATGADLGGADGALFRFLHHGKRSVVAAPDDPPAAALVAAADLVVEGFAPALAARLDWPRRHPSQVVLSITPFGRGGPYDGRPASELTLQAESGSISTRGLRGREPFQAGGRIGEWVGGTFAAVAALAALRTARATGRGEAIDFSLCECLNTAASNYLDVFHSILGRPEAALAALPQSVETPSIEMTADGWVGFCTNSAQQFSDFLLLIERPDLREDRALFAQLNRIARFDEWQAIVSDFMAKHTTAEIVERASLLRIPVSPVNDGAGVLANAHLRARGAFWRDPTGSFEMPRPPYKIDGETPAPPGPAPAVGEHTNRVGWSAREPDELRSPAARCAPVSPACGELPLAGVRILDLTAWWAGPSATHMLATLGADVVHVESVQRPDGMRMVVGMAGARANFWEWSPFYLASNSNKRGLTLNLTDPRGQAIGRRLVAQADAVIENFTPRVLDALGLGWDAIRAANPRCILVRMPAFGLDGPWRDHTGFAQTMEQMTGMAWLTGHADDQPRIQRGPCDPLSGMHATFAFLVALAERERTGRGAHVECTMVEGALNAAAEQILEWSAYGRRMERMGNRAPEAAPQNLYACAGSMPGAEKWLALSIQSDAHWRALVAWLGTPAWTRDPALATHVARRAAHDAIDAELRRWFATRDREAAVEALVAAGIPAAPVRDARLSGDQPQMAARGFYETIEHPVVGRVRFPTVPFRFAGVDHWLRRPAPTLGEHSREILSEWIGVGPEELDALARDAIIGTEPVGR
jgi:crotonobetainyl-CoA:carnitine CoA-transferase CaiB-like acyl-CoA transferase